MMVARLPHINLLNDFIDQSGYKREHIARCMGISTMSLARKLNGETDFKLTEIRSLIKQLNLTSEQAKQIFCA